MTTLDDGHFSKTEILRHFGRILILVSTPFELMSFHQETNQKYLKANLSGEVLQDGMSLFKDTVFVNLKVGRLTV